MTSLLCRETISIYLDTVFSYCDGFIPLRSFPEKGGSKDNRPHAIWMPNDSQALEAIVTFASYADSHDMACYTIPGTVTESGEAAAEHIRQMQTLLVDIDSGDIQAKQEHLIRYLCTPTLIVESGGITEEGQAKLHLYWKLSEPAEDKELKLLLHCRHMMATKIGGDPHFRSAHQPIRIAGSVYHKHGQAKGVRLRSHKIVEYHLEELMESIEAMPYLPGIEPVQQELSPQKPLDFNDHSISMEKVLTTHAHEGAVDGWTRFEGISRVIGYWLRRYHEGIIPHEQAWGEIVSYNTACIVPPWPEDRLKDETNRLWQKHLKRYGEQKPLQPQTPIPSASGLKSYSLRSLLQDRSPMPADIIAPRILTPGGLLVFAGAPKVGKSDFLLTLFVHLAAGEKFLDFVPARPLRIFYLQAEVQYDYLRERLQSMSLKRELLLKAEENLITTPQVRMLLNEQGVEQISQHIATAFPSSPPDIIAIDPIRNVFDGGKDAKENDNNAMLFFLQERVEKLREAVHSQTGVILVHHTRKITKKQLEEDPFQALSGAGSLRGFYSTGLLLYRPRETSTELNLIFELRNGAALLPKTIEKVSGQWIEIDRNQQRIVHHSYGERLDAERIRKREVIVEIIYEQARLGNLYNSNQFAERFENTCGLGGKDTILDRISVCATKGYIKFVKNVERYGLPAAGRSKYGYLCVEAMRLGADENAINIPPSHYKHPQTGVLLEVENPSVWVYSEQEEAHAQS